MANENYPKWINGYAKAICKLGKSHDPDTHLPFNGFNFYPLFDDLWVDKIYNAIQKFHRSSLKLEEIIDFLPTHSSMKFNLLEIIIDLKTSNTDSSKAKFIVKFFVEAIKMRAVSKNWYEDNKIWEYEDVEEIIKNKKLVKADRELSIEVGRIIAGCGNLAYGLYNDFCTDYGYDVFGPYDTSRQFGDRASFFVRQFIDLKPVNIWPERKNFPYKTIKVYTIYNNVVSESYYIGCHMNYKQSLVDNLSYFQVEIDNNFVNSLVKLKEVREVILQNASEHYVMYKNVGFEEHKRIWLWQLCYQFKNFFKKVGVDWRPSDEMIKRVKDKELVNYITSYDVSFKKCYENWGINYLKAVYA